MANTTSLLFGLHWGKKQLQVFFIAEKPRYTVVTLICQQQLHIVVSTEKPRWGWVGSNLAEESQAKVLQGWSYWWFCSMGIRNSTFSRHLIRKPSQTVYVQYIMVTPKDHPRISCLHINKIFPQEPLSWLIYGIFISFKSPKIICTIKS